MKDIYGVLGHPLKHSLSPLVFTSAFKEAGIKAEYKTFDVNEDEFEEFMQNIVKNNIKGLSVTIPYKIKALEFMENVSEIAAGIGSINTIKNDNGFLKGENFDASSTIEALEEKINVNDKNVTVLGAGGAALAILYMLKQNNCKTTILSHDQNLDKALLIAKKYDSIVDSLNNYKTYSDNTDILINTTPAGMYPDTDVSPIDPKFLNKKTFVFDIVYNPICTKLIKGAMEAGCNIQTGDKMFLLQAAKQFEYWTGEKAPREVMEKAFEKALC